MQNRDATAALYQNYIQKNPFPINMQSGPQMPNQINGSFGGGSFGGQHGEMMPSATPPPPNVNFMPGQQAQQPGHPMAPPPRPEAPTVAPGQSSPQVAQNPFAPGQQAGQPFGPNQHNLMAILRQAGLIH